MFSIGNESHVATQTTIYGTVTGFAEIVWYLESCSLVTGRYGFLDNTANNNYCA
jgi:hypothetical protein